MQKKFEVPDNMRLPELTDEVAKIAPDMMVECVRKLPLCLENAWPQSHEGVTYAKKINKDIGIVRWTEMTARDVYNLHRAIYGLHSLVTQFTNKKITLIDSFLVDYDEIEHSKPIGTVEYSEKHNAIRVLCRDRRYVYFKSVRIIGKRQISAVDFYNGYLSGNVDTRQPKMFCRE